jgi:DNA polymerase-4
MDAASILHADLDSFYAAVEVRDDPSLRGRPVAVGGGVVLAATYEARRFGVRSAMTGREARRRCPGLVIVPARFDAYVEASRRVMEILEGTTPLAEPISIDEAFLDVSGSVALFGSPEEIGQGIRSDVREHVGLPISVGVATTKHLAKIASRVAKPDGIVVVDAGRESEFLHPLPVGHLWGVGRVTEERLGRYGIRTIGELAALPPGSLGGWLGPHWGRRLWDLAHNRDVRQVETERTRGSVGAQSAGPATDVEVRHRNLLALAERIGTRLRRRQRAGRRVTVRVRFSDMQSATRAATLPGPISETTAIYQQSAALADALVAERAAGREITLVGISIALLEQAPHIQLELPLSDLGSAPATRAGSTTNVRHHDLDAAVDRARERFGRSAVQRAAVVRDRPEVRSPIDQLDGPDQVERVVPRGPG